MSAPNDWFRPRGTLTRDDWDVVVDASIPGWQHTGLRVTNLDGQPRDLAAGNVERLVVPLSGGCRVTHDGQRVELTGRSSVFGGPTDVLFLGAGTGASIVGEGRVAVAEAPTAAIRPSVYLSATDYPVEIRGAGRDTRQVHNFGLPGVLDAGSLIVCEVITPAGNWSSHPAHKHDESLPGHETQLEEIYYFEAAPTRGLNAPSDADAFGNFVTYSSSAGAIDTNAMVRSGDVALVPYGYHGPATAPPEYDLYYLNVMAGPVRAWLISDDPAQSWVRDTWTSQTVDARLPYGREGQ